MKKFTEWLSLREDIDDNQNIGNQVRNAIMSMSQASEAIQSAAQAVSQTYNKNDTVTYLNSDWLPSLTRAVQTLNNDLQQLNGISRSILGSPQPQPQAGSTPMPQQRPQPNQVPNFRT